MDPTTCQDLMNEPVDPISAALLEIALDNVVCCRSELSAPWSLEVPVDSSPTPVSLPELVASVVVPRTS